MVRLDRGSGLLCGVVIGVRLCLPSGLAAGVGMGVVEAEACFIRGSGLGVRAVSARSRAARARASGEEGSEERKDSSAFIQLLVLSSSELEKVKEHLSDVPRGFPVSGWRKVCGVGEGDRTGAGGGSSPRSSIEWL